MNFDRFTKIVLITIALLLVIVACHPFLAPNPVQAQIPGAQFYVEPVTTMLRSPDGSRQVLGKVVIDLPSGKVWGFPTLTEVPYPVNTTDSQPPISHPIYLGQFDFAAMNSARSRSDGFYPE
jgi:hypothetical protein